MHSQLNPAPSQITRLNFTVCYSHFLSYQLQRALLRICQKGLVLLREQEPKLDHNSNFHNTTLALVIQILSADAVYSEISVQK